MLPVRQWPLPVWLGVIAVVLLLAHAVGLVVQLLLQSEGFGVQAVALIGPLLATVAVGLAGSWSASRHEDARIARLGRILAFTIGLLVVAIVLLTVIPVAPGPR
jgi:hypothetical protein